MDVMDSKTTAQLAPGLSPRPSHFTPPTSSAASLATADEVLLRCAPKLMADRVIRGVAERVVERGKADLLEVINALADGLDGNSEINLATGEFSSVVEPAWFWKFQRVLERHTGRRVLSGIQLRGLESGKAGS